MVNEGLLIPAGQKRVTTPTDSRLESRGGEPGVPAAHEGLGSGVGVGGCEPFTGNSARQEPHMKEWNVQALVKDLPAWAFSVGQ